MKWNHASRLQRIVTVLAGMALSLLNLVGRLGADDFQGATHLIDFEQGIFSYSKSEPSGAVARLDADLRKGLLNPRYDTNHGWLTGLLDHLKIPRSSQLIIFSKSSLQRDRISPTTPRALYFNDDFYIGYIPGSPILEISVADPTLGGVFYSVDQGFRERPRLSRSEQCLECHASGRTMGVPGHFARSFRTDESGRMEELSDVSPVTHRTPYSDRWGGWYVTGAPVGFAHRGNQFGAKEPPASPVTDLSPYFEVSRYPVKSSDAVAHLVFEHQLHLHNYLTRLHCEARIQLSAYGHLDYLRNQIAAFLRYLLFTEEAPFPVALDRSSAFAREFSQAGLRDSTGRSLRDFDLHTRLFKYPCSYLIYSEAFDQLPVPLRDRIYRQLYNILTGRNSSEEFRSLKPADRLAILEILRDTKQGLPDYWSPGGGGLTDRTSLDRAPDVSPPRKP